MPTPTKLTMYTISPQPPVKRSVRATFELKDGKVECIYFGNNKEESKEKLLQEGLYDVTTGKSYYPKDGEKFMQLMKDAFPHSSFVEVCED